MFSLRSICVFPHTRIKLDFHLLSVLRFFVWEINNRLKVRVFER